MRTINRIPHIILTATLILIATLIYAVEVGRIKGRVTDSETGDPIKGATVQVVGTIMGTTTDQDGHFILTNVPVGKYDLKFSAVSYVKVEIKNIAVECNQDTHVDARMENSIKGTGQSLDVKSDKEKNEGNTRKRIEIKTIADLGMPPSVSGNKPELNEIYMPTPDKYVPYGKPNLAARPPQIDGGACDASNDFYKRRRPAECPSYPPRRQFDAMYFKDYGAAPFVYCNYDNKSTFATDIDDASFILARSYLERGALPPSEAIRVEEFINHLDYGYQSPKRGQFSVDLEGAPSPFGWDTELLRIGIKGCEIDDDNRKPANLIFVIDVSGSMNRENRLGLVKQALNYLVDQMDRRDRIGIVTFNTEGREIIQPTGMQDRGRVYSAITSLSSGGSTNLAEGLRLGYRMAERNFEEDRINRIVLISDGVANTGLTDADEMLRKIKRFADMGVTLTSVGVGMGNHNDALLEQLGDKGNGFYAYVDDLAEARRVFVENLTGLLQVIARDVKIQVEFNPNVVEEWRLVGYENRAIADYKFRDDREDGGEIGSGHEVTALYEIRFRENKLRADIGRVHIRYKNADGSEVDEFSVPIKRRIFMRDFEQTSPQFRLAAALAKFGEILKQSPFARNTILADVENVFRQASRQYYTNEVAQTLDMICLARNHEHRLAGYNPGYNDYDDDNEW